MSLIKRKNSAWMDMPFFKLSNSHLQTNVKENENNYSLEITIPGFEKEDLKLSVDDGYLTIEAEKSQEINDQKDHYIRRERRYGRFSRSFYIGDIDSEQVTASYQNGILYVDIPKSIENDKKLIEIK